MQILVTMGSGILGWWGRILGFSIDLRRGPYNTPALYCSSVWPDVL